MLAGLMMRDRAARINKALAWTLVLAVALAVLALPAGTFLRTLVIDDALYYPVIARSIAAGQGSTYDGGITRTNGYHPLWCWSLLPWAAVFGDAPPLVYLWWFKGWTVIVVGLCLWTWHGLVRDVWGRPEPALVFLLLAGAYWWSINTLYSGMETPLVLLMAGLFLRAYRRALAAETITLPRAALLGLLLGATFLSRLDSAFFIAVYALHLALVCVRRGRLAPLFVAGAISLAVVAPYLLWNLHHFDHVVPVSGLKKTGGLDLVLRAETMLHFWSDKWNKALHVLSPAGIAGLGLLALAALAMARREIGRALHQGRFLWPAGVAALLHYLYINLFMTEGDIFWYHYLEYFSVFGLLAALAGAAARRLESTRWPGAALLPVAVVGTVLMLLLALYAPRRWPNGSKSARLETARWAATHLPADARCGMLDSGIFRFVSDRATMTLNGLAGDRELSALVQAGDPAALVRRYGLQYMITFLSPAETQQVDPRWILFASPPYQPTAGWAALGTARFLVLDARLYLEPAAYLPPIR